MNLNMTGGQAACQLLCRPVVKPHANYCVDIYCDIAGFNVLYYVLYCLFLSTCVLQSVCVHTMDFVSANKQIN